MEGTEISTFVTFLTWRHVESEGSIQSARSRLPISPYHGFLSNSLCFEIEKTFIIYFECRLGFVCIPYTTR